MTITAMTTTGALRQSADIAVAIVDAVRDVLGAADTMIALHEPEFAGNEAAYVADCINTGWVSSVGSYVDRFERDLAAFTGSAHAVATMNGTAVPLISSVR